MPSSHTAVSVPGTAKRPIILHAEDDDNDAFFLHRALKNSKLAVDLVWVKDGKEAVEYVERAQSSGEMPSLLLLDIKMPIMDGFDVLAWLYKDRNLKSLPVVMLSGSLLASDMEKAKMLGAVDYMVKAVEPDRLEAIVQKLCSHLRSLAAGTDVAQAIGPAVITPP
jgi:two-component system response regulator